MVIRVAMIAHHPQTNDQIDGGVQAVTSYLVNSLAKTRDLDLHVLSFAKEIDRVLVTKHPNYSHYSIPLARYGTATWFIKDQARLNSCLATIRPDIVHSQGGGHHGVLATRSHFPSVVTIHGIHRREARFLPGLKRRFRAMIEGWIGEQYYIRHASHTILISPYVADHYGSELSGKHFLIPNPVDPSFYDVARREKPGKILFAGRLYKLKGVTDLLHAAAKLTNYDNLQIVLAGSLADTDYVSELRAETDRLNLTGAVTFRGILRKAELLAELSECAVLVLPSYQETAPVVIQEAMAAGVPIVASNICGIPYQIDDGKSGLLFPPGNVDALAEKLDLMLSHKKMRKRIGETAKLKAIKHYKADAVARQTMAVYREIYERRDVNEHTKF
jgi:glycosyltransferase involved in cell wall biosynthesis